VPAFLAGARERRLRAIGGERLSPLQPFPPETPGAARLERAGAPAPAATAHRSTGRPPVLLGIDPGTRAVGYGAVLALPRSPRFLAAGVLRPDGRRSVPVRLGQIGEELEALLARIRPAAVVVERAFASRNIQSALRIGEGRGVVLACAARFGADVVEYAPAAVKKALVGNGAASKQQVAGMVAAVLAKPGLDLPHDATDALALALTHANRARS